jgi:NADH-quinone oxidoreductase subunit F
MAEGHAFKGYLPGGASGGILPASKADIPMDFGTLESEGCFTGSGAVVVLSDKDDMKAVALNLLRFFEDESCGQCTPCREGTGWMWRVMERMVKGNASVEEIDMLLDVSYEIEGHTICALGDAAAWPVQGLIRHFRPEMEARIRSYRDAAARRAAA